jgi:hypothetical protein
VNDKDFDLFTVKILDIFTRLLPFDKDDKVKWFNHVLDDFMVFGYTTELYRSTEPFGGFRRLRDTVKSDKTLDYNKPLIKTISLSSYLLISHNNHYLAEFLHRYPEKHNWSHHGVLTLIKIITDASLRVRFKHLINDKEIWKSIKCFCNMIFGFINSQHVRLCVSTDNFDTLDFVNSAEQRIFSYLKEENIVILDQDIAVLNIDLKTYISEYTTMVQHKALGDYSNTNLVVEGCSDLKDDNEFSGLKELNKICRKFKIDIVP